jgi:hypothetical protein
MVVARLSVEPSYGRAFGIDIESSFRIPCIPEAAPNGSEHTSIELVTPEALERMWRGARPEVVIDRRLADGRRLMTIDYDREAGYRIWASRFGRHLITNDGLQVVSALPAVAPWRWQRLLFAQVLPLSAALRGLDPFHASAVVLGERAVALVAASGSGKTSLAAHLVARGAPFMTDDVLSLQLDRGRVLAHPGAAMTSIAPKELASMSARGRAALGPSIGREAGKKHFMPPVVDRPHPLGAFVVLVRNADVERLELETVQAPDARLLLSSSFITYIRSPEHLVTHLDTCARISESVPVVELRVPPWTTAAEAAALVSDRLEPPG